MKRTTYVIRAELKAVTPLSVSQPNSSFGRSDDISRLPRQKHGDKNSPCYFPESTFTGALRHLATDLISATVNADDPRLDTDQMYMLKQGVDTTDAVYGDTPLGAIKPNTLREKNPLLSLFGRWAFASSFKISDFIPTTDNCVTIRGTGTRTDMFQRSPENLNAVSNPEKVHKMLSEDLEIQREVAKLKKEQKEKYNQSRLTDVKSEKDKLVKEIAAIDEAIDGLLSGKTGGKNAIQRPLPGSEAFMEGTTFTARGTLAQVNELELALFLQILRAFSATPFLGSRQANFGEVEGVFKFQHRAPDSDYPVEIGEVKFGYDGFTVTDNNEEKTLSKALKTGLALLTKPAELGVDYGTFFYSQLDK